MSKIAVNFPSKNTWPTLFGNYSDLKEMLTEKYGKPATVVESFEDHYQPNDDRAKLSFVGSDKCKYFSIWKTYKGNIELSISHIGYNYCFVTLIYYDRINGEQVRAKAKEDL
jgi:hypothetical protein